MAVLAQRPTQAAPALTIRTIPRRGAGAIRRNGYRAAFSRSLPRRRVRTAVRWGANYLIGRATAMP